jgi:broad specificity phosphatase PhoE
MRVYFARHGETTFNLKKILMGQRYDVDLDKTGITQAQELAAHIPTEVNLIFSSPLKRALHTASIIAEKKKLSVNIRDELRERDYGSLSGKSWAEIEKEVGFSLEHIEENLDVDLSRFSSESINLVRFRLMHFLADLKKHNSDKIPLVVAHSGIIRLMHQIYPKVAPQDTRNASLHVFEI